MVARSNFSLECYDVTNMARLKLSEYAGKKLLIGSDYEGVTCNAQNYQTQIDSLTTSNLVVKVDVGVKKRNQKGLVMLELDKEGSKAVAQNFFADDYDRVLIEPYINHDEASEEYVSIELVRGGFRVLYAKQGGVAVEQNNNVISVNIPFKSDRGTETVQLPPHVEVLSNYVISVMKQYHLVFVEINPFTVVDGVARILDVAAEIDSSFLGLAPDWLQSQVNRRSRDNIYEHEVRSLNEVSPATFSLTVFSEEAAIYTLLSGGGASLVVLDSLVQEGLQKDIGNYGEYSGAPSQEETKLYTDSILKLLLNSTAKRKVLLIAGGVANFTDVRTTFSGITDSLADKVEELQGQSVLVLVRRGGPHQEEGLQLLRNFLIENKISHKVFGAEMSLSELSKLTKEFLYD